VRLSIHIKQTLSIDRGSADAIKPYQLFVKKETFHGTEKTINISQSGEEDLAAATEDYQDGMHVDEVIREVTTETIPKESSQATLVTGGEHGDDDAEGETAADADDDGEEEDEAGEGNENGQEENGGEDSANDPVAQHVSTYLSLTHHFL